MTLAQCGTLVSSGHGPTAENVEAMLLVATLSLDSATVPAPQRAHAARRAIATLSQLARLHELVIVADWPDGGWTVRSLVDALASALPWHEIVLVAARTDTHGRHAGGISNVPTVRRLVEDGAVVICLAGGPGRDRTEPVATALAAALHADRVVRLTGEDSSPAGRHHDVQVRRAGTLRHAQRTLLESAAPVAATVRPPRAPAEVASTVPGTAYRPPAAPSPRDGVSVSPPAGMPLTRAASGAAPPASPDPGG